MGRCETTEYDEAVQTNSMFWYGTRTKVGQFTRASNEYFCPPGGPSCPMDTSYTITNFYSFKVGANEGFDISVIAAQVSPEISFTKTWATASGGGEMSLPPGVLAYAGFATKWVEVKGHYFVKRRTCCRGQTPECTTEVLSKRDYDVSFPRTLASYSMDGIYTLCSGDLENQNCYDNQNTDMERCMASDTILPNNRLEGCTDSGCYDPPKMLVSTNNVNRVVIHINGKMCVYGSRDGRYTNTWCINEELAPSEGFLYGTLQENGSFCLYTKAGCNYYCTTPTGASNGGYRLIMQNDGGLVIYTSNDNPIWHSGTGYGKIPFPYCGKNHGGGGNVCSGGNPGSEIEHGEGACCETERDCKDCCGAGVCNAACFRKRRAISN